jgi:hypothetical protein
MRAFDRALFVLSFVLAGFFAQEVFAKDWKGVTPGKTSREQVLEKFGKPTKEFSRGGRLSDGVNYKGDQAIEGSLEANFFFNKHGVLFRIDVFPAREITRAQVVRIFGKDYVERVTRTEHTLFNYFKVGMVVFFEKDADIVLTFVFTEAPTGRKGGDKAR